MQKLASSITREIYSKTKICTTISGQAKITNHQSEARTWQNGCRTRVRRGVQRATPLPTCRCRIHFFFFALDTGQFSANLGRFTPIRVESVCIGRNRPIQAKLAYSGWNSKKIKGAKRTVWPKSSGSLSTQGYQLICVYAIVVLFEFLLLYMWKKFVLYTVEFWVS